MSHGGWTQAAVISYVSGQQDRRLKTVRGVIGASNMGTVKQVSEDMITWSGVPWVCGKISRPFRCYLTGREMPKGERAYRPATDGHDKTLRAYAPAVEKLARDQAQARREEDEQKQMRPPVLIANLVRPDKSDPERLAYDAVKIMEHNGIVGLMVRGDDFNHVQVNLTKGEWQDLMIQIGDFEGWV